MVIMEENFDLYDVCTELMLGSIKTMQDRANIFSGNLPGNMKYSGGLGLTTDTQFINAMKDFNRGVDMMGKAELQSTNLKDKFVSLLGWFDNEVKGLNVNRSALLAKKDVKNYTYKRHRWGWWFNTNFRANTVNAINYTLDIMWYIIKKCEANEDPKEIIRVIRPDIDQNLYPYIDKYIGGRKKGGMYNLIMDYMIDGDRMHTMNFADDVSISNMMDLCNQLQSIDKKDLYDYVHARSLDLDSQCKGFISRYSALIKRGKTNAAILKIFQECITILNLCMTKFYEYDKALVNSFEIEAKEVISVLKGLLEYKGD